MKIGFIGTGNMGGALARAAAKGGHTLLLANRTPAKAEALAKELGGTVCPNAEAAETAELLFLGVKPQGLRVWQESWSRAAGAEGECARRRQHGDGRDAPGAGRHARRGTAAHPHHAEHARSRRRGHDPLCRAERDGRTAERLPRRSGTGRLLLPLPEAQIDAASAISGCGPAFCFQFADALALGGVRAGLSYPDACRLAAQTMLGAAEMLLQSGEAPDVLKMRVCSPAGTNHRGRSGTRAGADFPIPCRTPSRPPTAERST